MTTDQVGIHISEEDVPLRFAWTHGLKALGQAEIAVPLHWPRDPEWDGRAAWLLRSVIDFVKEGGRKILPGQTVRGPWSTLRFREAVTQGAVPASLVLQEMADPFGDPEQGFGDGICGTVEILVAQGEAARRNQLRDELDGIYPHHQDPAVVCTRLPLGTSWTPPFSLVRGLEDAPDDIWCVGCLESDHDHDDAGELVLAHLSHVAAAFPSVLQYLALPLGTALNILPNQVIVFPPGEDDGRPDPGSPLTWTLR